MPMRKATHAISTAEMYGYLQTCSFIGTQTMMIQNKDESGKDDIEEATDDNDPRIMTIKACSTLIERLFQEAAGCR